ncbi:phosphotransferase family protein [Natranaeroarchaeum aerophilus]|uniref:Aminoglycoside phosphotransferase family protein n=1 Tax=Natranaeroarchaeum aerophilus TaxID=2917711 RepID=A0AAE3FNR4_9EURY|nr:phosphotransferase [Natranaeroarchaeum aerophilus]MCL9812822.1 aminoglycoside phosphotransferase family protein [Natranaeroarchaeum aerophilus]
MGPDLSHVTAFTEHVGSGQSRPRSFYALDPPGEHYYLFRPTRAAFETVAGMIAGEGLKRRLGGYALRGCAVAPVFARLVPFVSTRTLDVGDGFDCDIAVLSNRTRLVDLGEQVVYTIPSGGPERVVDEVYARERLPPTITVPTLHDYDLDYPYLAEAFVTGTHPRSPVEGWPFLLDALDQLTDLYRNDPEPVAVSGILDDAKTTLDERGLLAEPPFDRAFDLLMRLHLPEYLYRAWVHRDLHTRNVLVEDERVCILDWESAGQDLVVRDLFRPFTIAYYDTRDPRPFVELCTCEGTGGEIVDDYIDVVGEYAMAGPGRYSGLPVLYLLSTLADKERTEFWESKRELLSEVIDRIQ